MKNRIRELRAEKNITQLRLSLELEVSQETVSAYENGKHLPSLKSLIKMADIFHVSTDYLLTGKDHDMVENRTKLLDVVTQLTEIAKSM